MTWARFALSKRDIVPAHHHLVIMQALERVDRGETTRLLLLLPPGSAKSTYSSLVFPPWWFARHPTSAVITACHTAGLAEHFGRGVRDLIAEHGARLGVRMRPDARAATRFLTESGGEYFGVGIHGAVTGRRADLALIDDPIASFAEAETLSAREHLWNWFRTELLTRLKPGGRMIFGTGVAPGSTITAVNAGSKTITFSPATAFAIAAGATIYTGAQTPNPAETQRLTYNAYLHNAANLAALNCTGLIDDNASMTDPAGSGKWRADLGAASVDGVHPNAVLHQAVINAGSITAAMFPAR